MFNWKIVIGEDLSIKRVRFSDIEQEDASGVQADSAAEGFGADFAIMTLEFTRVL